MLVLGLNEGAGKGGMPGLSLISPKPGVVPSARMVADKHMHPARPLPVLERSTGWSGRLGGQPAPATSPPCR